jgi:hypothetical protein
VRELVSAALGDKGDNGAECIAALCRGEDSDEADAGAQLAATAIKKWLKYGTK